MPHVLNDSTLTHTTWQIWVTGHPIQYRPITYANEHTRVTSTENRKEKRGNGESLEVGDGRTIAYAEYGSPNGRPVVFFPGTPGSRLFRVPEQLWPSQLAIRLIVPDRPGYGRSTPAPERGLVHWSADMAQMANELGFDTFAIAGHSGGAAFALACAAGIPERVSGVGLISAIAPFSHAAIQDQLSESDQQVKALVESDREGLYDLATDVWGPARDEPESAFERLIEASPRVDQEVLRRDEIRAMMVANLAEAFRQGTDVWAHESELFFSDWGFELNNITVHVDIWQGVEDELAPPFMAEYLGDHLPNCTVRIVPDEGHTVFVTHWSEILQTVTGSC